MVKTTLAALLLLAAGAAPSLAADPILGKWRSPNGRLVEVRDCGGRFCATVLTGRHKGRSVGTLEGGGGDYTGTVIDPRSERTYRGTATVEGASLRLQGCALRVVCRTQNWTRA